MAAAHSQWTPLLPTAQPHMPHRKSPPFAWLSCPPPLSSLPRKPKFSIKIGIIRKAKVQPAGAIRWHAPTSLRLWQHRPDEHGCLLQAQYRRSLAAHPAHHLSDKPAVRTGKPKQMLQTGCDGKLDMGWSAPQLCTRSPSISYQRPFIPHCCLPWKHVHSSAGNQTMATNTQGHFPPCLPTHTHTRPLTALKGSALQIAPWGSHTPSPQPCLLWTNARPGTAASISITCFHMLLSRHLISVSKPSETHLCHSYLAFKS